MKYVITLTMFFAIGLVVCNHAWSQCVNGRCFPCPTPLPRVDKPADIGQRQVTAFKQANGLKNSIVKVKCGNRIGTGFIVSKQGNEITIWTNEHVTGHSRRANITWFGDQCRGRISIGLVRFSTSRSGKDAAVITCRIEKGISAVPISLSEKAVVPGSFAYLAGVPFGDRICLQLGEVLEVKSGMILLRPKCFGGMSGGPVFDGDGNVIGVVTGYLLNDSQPTMALPISDWEELGNAIRR